MKNKLEAEEVIKLKLVIDQEKELVENKKEAFLYGLAGGMCFDFNKFEDHLFLVGTEEGKIHLCSKAYSGQYLETYDVLFPLVSNRCIGSLLGSVCSEVEQLPPTHILIMQCRLDYQNVGPHSDKTYHDF